MKRKIALFLAAAMTLSMLPMTVSAASRNSVSKVPIVISDDTNLVEGSQLTGNRIATTGEPIGTVNSNGSSVLLTQLDYDSADVLQSGGFTGAGNFIIEPQDDIAKGASIKLVLTNGTFNFSNEALPIQGTTSPLYPNYDVMKGSWDPTAKVYTRAGFDPAAQLAEVANADGTTVNLPKRQAGLTGTRQEYGYKLTIGEDETTAVLTLTEDVGASVTSALKAIVVPLVINVEDEGQAQLEVISNLTEINSGTWAVARTGGTAIDAFVKDTITAKYEFPLKALVFNEKRIRSISNGQFVVAAPSGFYFLNDSSDNPVYNKPTASVDPSIIELGLKGAPGWLDIKYVVDSSGRQDFSKLHVTLTGITPSDSVVGAIYIKGLVLIAEDNAPFGEINLKVTNYKNEHNAVDKFDKVLAGNRQEWNIILTTDGTIPELVNGRYEEHNMMEAVDEIHKTATVVFKENSVAAWWADRVTIFSLPEQVKFRKVLITTADNMFEDAKKYESSLLNADVEYTNTGKRVGYVTVDGNTMTIINVKVAPNKKAELNFDAWVSIESGFTGDINLTVDGSAIPEKQTTKIATAINPVSITTSVTDIKIGYQLQAVQNIKITEAKAGILEKGKRINFSVDDEISQDMYFSPNYDKAVTAGNIKLKDWRVNGGTISCLVDTQSGTASTIELSNLKLKIDRTVPQSDSSLGYKVIVWGTAIAENYAGLYGSADVQRDMFQVKGLKAPYVNVISSANDKPSVLTQEVKVTIGERFYVTNGFSHEMDAAAYVSTKSNSTMVPLRFTALAFGMTNNQVIWDPTNATATIIHPSKTIQFTANSNVMVIDGVKVPMLSPDGLDVSAEITGDRMYIPFRALGDAFGVPVTWDAATNSAIYNQGANVSTAAAVVASDANAAK